MQRLFILLLILGASTATPAAGQAEDPLVEVNANIINSASGNPVLAGKVTYVNASDASNMGVTRIKEPGKVSFYAIKPNSYIVTVKAEGFRTVVERIDASNAENGTIAMEVRMEPFGVGRVMRLSSLRFRAGKSAILESSYEELNQLVDMMNQSPTLEIRLEGHTDFRGNPELNQELSQERVEAVKQYLVEKGLSKSRIDTKAFGGTEPLSRENTQEARALNRRVEVRIISE